MVSLIYKAVSDNLLTNQNTVFKNLFLKKGVTIYVQKQK